MVNQTCHQYILASFRHPSLSRRIYVRAYPLQRNEKFAFKSACWLGFFEWYHLRSGHWNGAVWIPALPIVFLEAQYVTESAAPIRNLGHRPS